MEREVRYCRTEDGVQIAYTVYGSGPPLIITPFFFESFDSDYRLAIWSDFMNELSAGRRVVRYDNRGVGLSQREGCQISLVGFIRDLEAVVDAAGLDRFDLLGWTIGGFAAVPFAAAHPEKVQHVALYAPVVKNENVMPRDALNSLATLCRTNWQMASQIFADMSLRIAAPELGVSLAEWFRAGVSGDVVAAILEDPGDVSEQAKQIKAPTLILHRVEDSAIPFAGAQKLASLIPDARLVPLKGTINYPPMGDWRAIVSAIQNFLAPATPAPAGSSQATLSGLRTVLWTDLVAHTEMMSRLGDERGRAVLREHDRITREVLKAHGGTEVKTMGDGFMASFGSVTKAVECAIALQRAFAEREGEPLSIRVGLNAGEPIEEEGDLFGATVILASRIAAKAEGGEILVADTVRGLCSGKGFLFADRGEFVAKGFEEPVRVYEVRWRG